MRGSCVQAAARSCITCRVTDSSRHFIAALNTLTPACGAEQFA
jgi:hypothetical protein